MESSKGFFRGSPKSTGDDNWDAFFLKRRGLDTNTFSLDSLELESLVCFYLGLN